VPKTHLGIKSVDLARKELAGLLSVWVVEDVLLDLLGLGRHLESKLLQEMR
jgi:hypothetical protein